MHTFTVTNPEPAGCSGEGASEIVIVPPPTVSSVVPSEVCAGGGVVTIHGSDFFDAASVTFSDVLGIQPSFSAARTINAAGTQMTATMPGGTADPGEGARNFGQLFREGDRSGCRAHSFTPGLKPGAWKRAAVLKPAWRAGSR